MSENYEEIASKADEMFKKNEVNQCYKYLNELYSNGCRNPQVVWRLAKACYEVGTELPKEDKSGRNKYLTEGLGYAKEALAADPNIGEAHKWAGILTAEQDVGAKEKVSNAYIIRDHFLKAAELSPNDSTVFFCLGKWCYSIMQIGWLERTAATVLFGAPPTSSYLDALKYLEESCRLQETIQNTTLLGDTLVGMGKPVEAMIWYQKAVDLPVLSEKDKTGHVTAEERIKNTKVIY